METWKNFQPLPSVASFSSDRSLETPFDFYGRSNGLLIILCALIGDFLACLLTLFLSFLRTGISIISTATIVALYQDGH